MFYTQLLRHFPVIFFEKRACELRGRLLVYEHRRVGTILKIFRVFTRLTAPATRHVSFQVTGIFFHGPKKKSGSVDQVAGPRDILIEIMSTTIFFCIVDTFFTPAQKLIHLIHLTHLTTKMHYNYTYPLPLLFHFLPLLLSNSKKRRGKERGGLSGPFFTHRCHRPEIFALACAGQLCGRLHEFLSQLDQRISTLFH